MSTPLTPEQARREKTRAAKFFASLTRAQRFDLGDQLVLGEFDWRDWFDAKPTGTFMRALDDARMNWECQHDL